MDDKRPRWLVRLVVMMFAVALAGLLCEAVARVTLPRWAPRTAAITTFWHYHPALGWAHVPNTTGSFNAFGFETRVTINSEGFRDRERSYQRDPSKTRIAVVGDSMVWGYGVQDEDVFTRLIEKSYPELEVFNFGVSGYGTDQELLLLREQILRVDADVYILVISENDFLTNIQSKVFRIYEKPLFVLAETGDLKLTNSPVPRPNPWSYHLVRVARSSYVLNRIAQTYNQLRASGEPWPPPAEDATWKQPFPRRYEEELTAALLTQFHDEVRAAGAKVIFVPIDGLGVVREDLTSYFSAHVPVVNLDRCFPLDEFDALHVDDSHWSAPGHQRVMECLMPSIDDALHSLATAQAR